MAKKMTITELKKGIKYHGCQAPLWYKLNFVI